MVGFAPTRAHSLKNLIFQYTGTLQSKEFKLPLSTLKIKGDQIPISKFRVLRMICSTGSRDQPLYYFAYIPYMFKFFKFLFSSKRYSKQLQVLQWQIQQPVLSKDKAFGKNILYYKGNKGNSYKIQWRKLPLTKNQLHENIQI